MSTPPIANFTPSTRKRAFFAFTTVSYEQVEKGRISGIREGNTFFFDLEVCRCSSDPGRSENAMRLNWLGDNYFGGNGKTQLNFLNKN